MGASTEQGLLVDSASFGVAPAPPTLLKIVGGRVISSTGPTILASWQNPITTLIIGAANNPDRFEFDFNVPPDLASVSASSFRLFGLSGGAITGTVSLPSSSTARLQLATPLSTDTYAVQLNGTSTPTMKVGGIALDGEALALPSGNGVPGGDFLVGVSVVAGSLPPAAAPPPLRASSYWNGSQIIVSASPTCRALESDNALQVADANQWNFRHQTANLSQTLPDPLSNLIYLRGGRQWRMDIPLNLGYLSYPELQLSYLDNAATRGDCQGTIPAIIFNSRSYSGNVILRLTFNNTGVFTLGIRAIDLNGYYSMYRCQAHIID